MAGDIEEPFCLSFQVDSIHSGSISFGRFESESLSWERRSSFSHNRYLEEVEKYARPGSVTEKKAYFEAHFRRKAFLRQASSDSQVEKEGSVSENGSYETPTYEENHDQKWCEAEEPQHIHRSSDACHFDENSENIYSYGDVSGMECEVGLTGYAHSETGAETIDVDRVSHFDESSDDSTSSGVYQGGEFEETEAIAHSGSQLESTAQSADVENAVRCSDNEKFKSESGCNGSLSDTLQHDAQVELVLNGQAPEVAREEDVSYTKATDSASEVLQNHAQTRAEENCREREPAPNSIDLEDVRSCDHEENINGGFERNNATVDNVVHDVQVETIPNERASKLPIEECISRCTETRGFSNKTLKTLAPKSRAEEKRSAPGLRSRVQSSASLTRTPEVKKGTAQSSGNRQGQTPLRTRAQKPMPQLKESSLQSSRRISKENPQSSKGKMPQESRSEKDMKPKRGDTLQPTTPERTDPRRLPSPAGTKRIASTNKEIKRCAMNTSFRSERGEKAREIKRCGLNSSLRNERGVKIREQKKEPDKASQSAKKPAFKAKPMPSFYNRIVPQGSSGSKPQVVSDDNKSSKVPSKSLHVGTLMGERSMASSETVNIQPISPSKYERPRVSLGRQNCNVHSSYSEARCSSDVRDRTAKVSKPKVVAQRK